MPAIPERRSPTVDAIYRALEDALREDGRPHLGASVLGRECRRALWYAFRWCDDRETEGRALRIFRRGKLEEEQLVADLRAAGCEVITHDEHGRQYRFSDVGGHVGGSMDGAVLGLKEAPKTWHVVEFKTHNARSFAELKKNGVQKAKPEHWTQCQLYMHWSEMARSFYLAVNKDTDELYAERIEYDRAVAEALVAKARVIVTAPEPLERISEKPEFYVCKFCDARRVCHEKRLPPPSCRTCVHATPELDGDARWSCALYRKDLTEAEQRKGCSDHVYIPALVPWDFVAGDEPANRAEYKLNGKTVCNGTPEGDTFASAELYGAQDGGFDLLDDANIQLLRLQFGGRIESSSAKDPDDTAAFHQLMDEMTQ